MKYVFFIDDDELLRDLFPRAFKSWKRSWTDDAVEMHVADSTARLLDLLDLVTESDRTMLVTDGNMRGSRGFDLNGDELIEAVRAVIGERLVRAVIMTGNPKPFRASADRLGAELYTKPIDLDAFKQLLAEFVDS